LVLGTFVPLRRIIIIFADFESTNMNSEQKQCGDNCEDKSHGHKQKDEFGNLPSVPFESDLHKNKAHVEEGVMHDESGVDQGNIEKSHDRSEDLRGVPFQTDLSKNQQHVQEGVMHDESGGFDQGTHEKSHDRSEDLRGVPFQTDLSKNQEHVQEGLMHNGVGGSSEFSAGKENSGSQNTWETKGENLRSVPFKSDIDKNKEHVEEGVMHGNATF
jgi:hypothetical protein